MQQRLQTNLGYAKLEAIYFPELLGKHHFHPSAWKGQTNMLQKYSQRLSFL